MMLFLLVKTDSDYYTSGKYNYEKFQRVLETATENGLRFIKPHTKKA